MSQFIIITTTSDTVDVLDRIANRLANEKLAACCQISQPIKSVYQWNGAVESSSEFELKVKTTAVMFEEVSNVIKALHHYEVPQIVAVNVTHIDAAYSAWASESLS